MKVPHIIPVMSEFRTETETWFRLDPEGHPNRPCGAPKRYELAYNSMQLWISISINPSEFVVLFTN